MRSRQCSDEVEVEAWWSRNREQGTDGGVEAVSGGGDGGGSGGGSGGGYTDGRWVSEEVEVEVEVVVVGGREEGVTEMCEGACPEEEKEEEEEEEEGGVWCGRGREGKDGREGR
ncbi:hypothetical protein E2C01_080579 [Portunus trituberculatus]|uniref:Uncharacterized protein n=1 Tax=Portunus trituberculatus TaxID=210409 RepID=A0A5B7ITM2_PORTR|nr:hypothetical protein [Portunus trituberculatus]